MSFTLNTICIEYYNYINEYDFFFGITEYVIYHMYIKSDFFFLEVTALISKNVAKVFNSRLNNVFRHKNQEN
jgi:hypothetical protein